MIHFVLAVVGVLLSSGLSHAAMGTDTIAVFCVGKEGRNFGAEGRQPDGHDADPAVLALAPGRYTVADGSVVELMADGVFVLTPSKRLSVLGTEGDDILFGKSVAGCSKEQLSEALRRNQIAVPAGKPDNVENLKK